MRFQITVLNHDNGETVELSMNSDDLVSIAAACADHAEENGPCLFYDALDTLTTKGVH